MAKELPYFKFFVSEWTDGDITLEDMEAQGLFINICAYYWSNECNLKFSKAKKKFRNVNSECFKMLLESEVIKVDNEDKLTINFLDEQRDERAKNALKNKANGAKGGRPKNPVKTQEKPSGLILETQTKANQKAIREEEKREDKKKEEEIRKEESLNNKNSDSSINPIPISNRQEEMKKHLLSQQIWIEQVGMKMKGIDIPEKLKDFCNNEILSDGLLREENEIKRHFLNWIKIPGNQNSKENTEISNIAQRILSQYK